MSNAEFAPLTPEQLARVTQDRLEGKSPFDKHPEVVKLLKGVYTANVDGNMNGEYQVVVGRSEGRDDYRHPHCFGEDDESLAQLFAARVNARGYIDTEHWYRVV